MAGRRELGGWKTTLRAELFSENPERIPPFGPLKGVEIRPHLAHHYDVPLKELFLHEGDGILRRRLFGGRVVEHLATEQPQVNNLRADLVVRTEDGCIHQLEFQSSNEPDIGRRMLNYYLYLVNQHQKHIVQTVLYVGREPLRMEPAYTTPCLEFRFEIVNLRDFEAEPLLASDDWADIVLALLARGDTEKVIAAAIPRLQRMTTEVRAWASGAMILLSGIIKLEEFVSQRLQEAGMINVTENKVIGPLLLQAEEKGRIAGLSEGRQEGLQQGSQHILSEQLAEKFGPLPVWAAARLQSASTAELQLWAKRVLHAQTLEETFA